jgi:hypothetical protein
MKAGDTVMFTDTGRYARWFFGRLATVENYTPKAPGGLSHCRVRWLEPVPYHDRMSTVSDFCADMFTVC